MNAVGDVTSVSVSEPRFTRREVALLLASRRSESQPRGGHGHLISDATDPAHQYDWEVGLPTTDFAADALSKAQDEYKKTYPDADLSALLWQVTKKSDSR